MQNASDGRSAGFQGSQNTLNTPHWRFMRPIAALAKAMSVVGLAACAPIMAQAPVSPMPPATPVASPPAPPTLPLRDPMALPGDALPPPPATSLAPPRPSLQRPPEARPQIIGPTLEMAMAAAQAALARCKADNLTVGVAVSDSLGGLVAGLQMAGANPGRIFFAARKNLTAVEFAQPSSAVREKLRARDFDTLLRLKPNMVVSPGAVPLVDADGKLVGAIGVSGATSDQDEICAAAGAAAVRAK